MEDKKIKILEFFKDLEFNEKEHKYFVKGKELPTSVSGIIKLYTKPFDRERISLRVATKRGVPQEQILQEWDSKQKRACKKGTEVHLFGELYPFNRHLKPRNQYETAIVQFWNDVPSHIVPVIMEVQMYHKEYMFAGTADILLYNTLTGKYILGDYKTNEDLFKNFMRQKMLAPFGYMFDSPFSKYQLQLSLYQILLEQTGIEVEGRKLIWLRPTAEYEMYDMDDMTGILRECIKHEPWL